MKWLPPDKRHAAFALRVLVATCLAGCSNHQMSASNPFLAPDRVPPPATRTIAPAAAAPYYPGDSVPAAQNTPPAPAALVQSPAPVAPTAGTRVATSPPAAPQPLAFTNERTVAIPADDQKLRFTLPAPPPVAQTPQPLSAAPRVAAVHAPSSPVTPAAYSQPATSQPAPAAAPVPSATTDNHSGGPWRSPQLPHATSPVMQAQYVQPQPTPPTVPVTPQPQPQPTPNVPTMPVELQAVPSPATVPSTTPVEPTLAPPPRMRFPSLLSPSTWFTPQPAANQQLIGYMVPGPNGAMQMISVDQMRAMSTGTAQPATSVASADGFRPRGSATK